MTSTQSTNEPHFDHERPKDVPRRPISQARRRAEERRRTADLLFRYWLMGFSLLASPWPVAPVARLAKQSANLFAFAWESGSWIPTPD